MKPIVVITALATVMTTSVPFAGAATYQRLCDNLESRLQAAASPPRALRSQLETAVKRAYRDGCDGYTMTRGGVCRAHTTRIQRLRSKLAEAGPARVGPGQRSRLLSAIRANGCRSPGGRGGDRGGQIVRVDPPSEPIRNEFGDIPIPTVRPMSPAETYRSAYVEFGESLQDAADLREWTRLTQARPIPPERRNVRLVGTRFLPDPNEEMDFDRIAKGNADPLNDVLVGVLAWLDQGAATTAVAQKEVPEPEADAILTASLQ